MFVFCRLGQNTLLTRIILTIKVNNKTIKAELHCFISSSEKVLKRKNMLLHIKSLEKSLKDTELL